MAALTGPIEPVPVAVLARTSTLLLQDPAGFYVAGYYWDVESGALDLDQRGHGRYEQFTSQGIPRDGGLADLPAEARSPQPRFAAVVVEDIEPASPRFLQFGQAGNGNCPTRASPFSPPTSPPT